MVSSDYLPNIGGLAAHVFYISKALSSHGHDVFVVRPISDSEMRVAKVDHGEVPSFEIYFSDPVSSVAHIGWRSFAIVKGLERIFDVTGKPDIIHQHDHRFSTIAMQWMSRNFPWVWTNHTSSFLQDYNQGWLRQWPLKIAYYGVDGVIAVSDELRRKTFSLWGNTTQIRYIPNGVDISKFSPNNESDREYFGLNEGEFVVLCPRRMTPKNGVIYMAKAAKRLEKKYPGIDWRFVFLGGDKTGNAKKDKYAEAVRRVASEGRLQGKVSFLGDLPMEEMPHINSCADLIVIPSLMEAVSLSALEGMATQKPVVATNVGGLPQLIQHEKTGLLVPPKDPDSLARSIHRLYCDEELRYNIARSARECVVSQYSWEAIARKTSSFYRSIISRDTNNA